MALVISVARVNARAAPTGPRNGMVTMHTAKFRAAPTDEEMVLRCISFAAARRLP